MNEDQKLTALAAKAVGIEYPGGNHSIHDDGRLWDCNRLQWWNPLHDGGDANLLAKSCGLNVIKLTIEQKCLTAEAVRRAIVRAAAEIGKCMP